MDLIDSDIDIQNACSTWQSLGAHLWHLDKRTFSQTPTQGLVELSRSTLIREEKINNKSKKKVFPIVSQGFRYIKCILEQRVKSYTYICKCVHALKNIYLNPPVHK